MTKMDVKSYKFAGLNIFNSIEELGLTQRGQPFMVSVGMKF